MYWGLLIFSLFYISRHIKALNFRCHVIKQPIPNTMFPYHLPHHFLTGLPEEDIISLRDIFQTYADDLRGSTQASHFRSRTIRLQRDVDVSVGFP